MAENSGGKHTRSTTHSGVSAKRTGLLERGHHGDRLRSTGPIRTRVPVRHRGHVGQTGAVDGGSMGGGDVDKDSAGVETCGSSWRARASLHFEEGLKIP